MVKREPPNKKKHFKNKETKVSAEVREAVDNIKKIPDPTQRATKKMEYVEINVFQRDLWLAEKVEKIAKGAAGMLRKQHTADELVNVTMTLWPHFAEINKKILSSNHPLRHELTFSIVETSFIIDSIAKSFGWDM